MRSYTKQGFASFRLDDNKQCPFINSQGRISSGELYTYHPGVKRMARDGMSSASFGRILKIIVREETSGFQLTWCGIWKLCDGNFLVKIGSALDRSKISVSLHYTLR